MATAEAVAHGLPILAYATGAIGDWIEDGVNGILIKLVSRSSFSKRSKGCSQSVMNSISYGKMLWLALRNYPLTPGIKLIGIFYKHLISD
jgi:hypothetical protein